MDMVTFEKQRMVKRRLMETQSGTEVRRLHIVYFLSRKGRIEPPHLIRVHHLSRNGVRLRDIKRWLAELRGKDMPESFSWSYKRRYRTGHVWQDLMDDDLITPLSDNEYVLKGSEISSTTIKEEKTSQQKDQSMSLREDQKTLSREEIQSQHSAQTSMSASTKSMSEIEEESPTFGSETSTLTDESAKLDQTDQKSPCSNKNDENPSCKDKSTDRSSSPFYSSLLRKKNKKKKVTIDEKTRSNAPAPADDSSKTPPISEPNLTKSKSCSNGGGASSIFKNLISCGTVDANESAVVPINKKNNNKPNFLNTCSGDVGTVNSANICRRDNRLGGSQRVFGTPNWTQQQWGGRKSFDGVKDSINSKSELRDQRAAYKPVNGPICSQCGTTFKPEKLHSHMKSCKGMKALARSSSVSAAADKASKGSMECRNSGESASRHLLAH